MSETLKQRQHNLIQVGGLVRIAGLDTLEKPILLGILLEAKRSFDGLSKGAKQTLFKKGYSVLEERGKRKKKGTKKQTRTKEFYETDGAEAWLLL